MTDKMKRKIFLFISPTPIYKNSRLRTKTEVKLLPVTGRHLEFWGEGITSDYQVVVGPLKTLPISYPYDAYTVIIVAF